MKKKCVIIYIDSIPVMICDIKEVEPNEFIAIEKECKEHFATLFRNRYEKDRQLTQRIEKLEHEIAVLKGEEEE